MSRTVTEQMLLFSDTTLGNASTLRHGLLPKLSGRSTDVFKGDGTFGALGSVGNASGVLLYDYTIVGADKTSIDTNVDDGGNGAALLPTTYGILECWIVCRTTDASVRHNIDVTVNNDAGANYDGNWISGSNGVVGNSRALAQTSWFFDAHGDLGLANAASLISFTLPAYGQTTFFKVGYQSEDIHDSTAANIFSLRQSLGWRSTAAINRIKVTAEGAAKLKIGSRLVVFAR